MALTKQQRVAGASGPLGASEMRLICPPCSFWLLFRIDAQDDPANLTLVGAPRVCIEHPQMGDNVLLVVNREVGTVGGSIGDERIARRGMVHLAKGWSDLRRRLRPLSDNSHRLWDCVPRKGLWGTEQETPISTVGWKLFRLDRQRARSYRSFSRRSFLCNDCFGWRYFAFLELVVYLRREPWQV
jgi:hypothetical protein